MPQIITLSHANAPKEQRQPNHPRSALLWPVLLYVKQCAGDKVDLVMLAHHPEAWKTHKRKHVCTHTHGHACTLTHTHTQSDTQTLYSHQSHAPSLLSLFLTPTSTHTLERQRAPCMSELYPNTATVATCYNYYQMDSGKTY